jgi:hypothetical protein
MSLRVGPLVPKLLPLAPIAIRVDLGEKFPFMAVYEHPQVYWHVMSNNKATDVQEKSKKIIP